jgi:hypothetical protein
MFISERNIVGCGMHVQSVMKNIPVEKRCTCDKTKQKTESQKYQQFSSQSRYFTEPSYSPRR